MKLCCVEAHLLRGGNAVRHPLCLLVYTWLGLGVSSVVLWCNQGVPVVLGARWCFAPRPVSLRWCVVG